MARGRTRRQALRDQDERGDRPRLSIEGGALPGRPLPHGRPDARPCRDPTGPGRLSVSDRSRSPFPFGREFREAVAMQTNGRLMLIGLEGAPWTVLDPRGKRGLMPNLDALVGRSAHGSLPSTIPPMTSAAWTTMMTGCGPSRH